MMTNKTARDDAKAAAVPIRRRQAVSARACLAVLATICAFSTGLSTGLNSAKANWFTKLVQEAGEAGGKAGRLGIGGLDNAAAVIRRLPKKTEGLALAAHATPEGHWKFVNRDGEVFTAATPDEMGRVIPTLAPDSVLGGRTPELSLYLSETTVFEHSARLGELPPSARLHIVVDKDSFRIRNVERAGKAVIQADVRPNVVVPLTNRFEFDEAIWQLGRRLNRADIRVVSLEPGGPEALMSAPRFNKSGGTALVDSVDPDRFATALAGVRGQTVLVSGRVDGDVLHFAPSSGPARTLQMGELTSAAAANDVNLIVLQSAGARQPGGRNWLWQTVEVDGLKDAMKRATFADFINALGASRGQMSVAVTPQNKNRVLVQIEPSGTSAVPMGDVVGEILTEAVSSVTGNVVTSAINAHVNSGHRQRELDSRIIPGVPGWAHLFYFVGIVAGLMGLGVARDWWARVWKKETRGDYSNAAGYYAARVVKFLVFVLIFLPIVGLPAFVVGVLWQAAAIVSAPFRFAKWLFSRKQA